MTFVQSILALVLVEMVWLVSCRLKKVSKTQKQRGRMMAKAKQSEMGPDGVTVPQEVKPLPKEPESDRFPIVGIGASAGGLGAFEAFFSTMPADGDPGLAFVLVQHLARDHKSILSDLIRRYTRMQVFEVEDGMEIKPNCAYIIPPNRDMAIENGALKLFEPTLSRGVRLPIDFFFRSLAQDQHDRAICIVLSGTGSDGALGVRAVKGEGGMVMVQTPESTDYDGMPRNAIATGMVDFVLVPHEMPAQLLAYVSQTTRTSWLPVTDLPLQPSDGLQKIFYLIRSQTGRDFSEYKRNTVIRRVERRMAVHQIEKLEDYVRYLQLTSKEVDALFRDLLIGVTNFFRDPEVFEELQKSVIPKLLTGRPAGATIRVWVAGCSTGEEAYSLAMLIREQMDEMKVNFKVQIFATDIDRTAIDHARAGIYPSSIIADISAERLAHFFYEEQPDANAYRIHKNIRDMLIFSEHDFIKDPPFSKLDLISCRNVLIYISTELQKKLMPVFHYALNPGGFLVLGSSESVGEFGNLFATLDRKLKMYQRKVGEPGTGRFRSPPYATSEGIARQGEGGATTETRLPMTEIAQRALLEHYSPAGALVNEHGDILYLVGRTGRYLEPTPGEARMNIFRMAREGLRGDLTIALHRAVSLGIPMRQRGLTVKSDAVSTTVNLTIVPVAPERDVVIPFRMFLIILEEVLPAEPRLPATLDIMDGAAVPPDFDTYIIQLKQEIRAKDEYLQTAIEEVETSNEELRSAHEEMQSVNEEMQSTNEELETSKEELQSVNEELVTVNGELEAKVADLSRSINDMKNLIGGTGIGTIFVDHALRILRFNQPVSALINLIETDVGRPVDQISSNFVAYDRLAADIRTVLQTLVPAELEVQTKTGEWYLLRIIPYRTLENVIEGAVITFTEISVMKKAQGELRDSEGLRRLAVVVRDGRDAILVLGMAGGILAWNPAAERMYGWSEAEALLMNIRNLIPDGEQEAALAALQRQSKAGVLEPLHQKRIAKDGRTINVSLIVASLAHASGETYAVATTERPE